MQESGALHRVPDPLSLGGGTIGAKESKHDPKDQVRRRLLGSRARRRVQNSSHCSTILVLNWASMGGGLILRSACVLALLVFALSGCGGGSSTEAAETESRPYPWIKGPAREFLLPTGDNVVQTFGREGTKAEREQASETIEAWMRARAAQDWKKDCSYFSKAYNTNITDDAHGVTGGRVKNCPQALAYFKHEASGDYVNNLSGPIDSLRVGLYKGQRNQGYAQYHGNDGKDWIVPMSRDEGSWKVSIASPIDRNK